MVLKSSESAQRFLSSSESDVAVDHIRSDTKVAGQHRETQPPLKRVSPLSEDSASLSTDQNSSRNSVCPRWDTFALDSSSIKKRSDSAILLDPRDLSWSSSTARTWNRLSPASSVGVWDLPETPPRLSDTPSPGQTWTPLTPPTPPSPSLGRRSGAKIVPKKLRNSYFEDGVGLGDLDSTSQEKDAFQPKKLFRNHTLELEKITKANATAGDIKYSREPSFVFSSDEPQPISSRTRSKTNKEAPLPKVGDPTQTVVTSSIAVTPVVSASKLPSLLERILPLDLYKRLGSVHGGCIASVASKSFRQCGNRPQGSLRDALAITKDLARYKSKKGYKTLLRKIEELVRQAMCFTHQKVVLEELKEGARIEKLRNYLSNSRNLEKLDQQALYQWLDVISTPDASTDNIPWVHRASVPNVPAALPSKRSKPPKTALSDPKPNEQISSFKDFTPYQLKRTIGISISDALANEIKRPLGAKEINSGFVYIFWDKRYFGKLKIGYTKDIKARLEKWNKQCGKEHSYLSQDDRSRVKMPHVGRVERLIHTELKECREKRRCEGCGILHQEWFGEDEVHAVKVVRKWQEWMMQQPYEMNASGQWVLKPEMLESLEQVCEPLAREKVVVKQTRKSEGAKRSSRRKSGRKTM